jgi:predicted nucleic acid-binding protein
MRGFLLDTNCISEAVRLHPEPGVMAWIRSDRRKLALYLSVLTLGEIREGLAALPPSRRRARLETWLEAELSGRVLSIDSEVADRWD